MRVLKKEDLNKVMKTGETSGIITACGNSQWGEQKQMKCILKVTYTAERVHRNEL